MRLFDADAVNARMVVIDKPVSTTESPAVLGMTQSKDFAPISLETAAGVVAKVRPIAKERWNVDLRLSPTFDALPDDVKQAVRSYGNTKAKDVLCAGHRYRFLSPSLPCTPSSSDNLPCRIPPSRDCGNALTSRSETDSFFCAVHQVKAMSLSAFGKS